MLCLIILAYALWKDSVGCSRASVARLARLTRLALDTVRVLVGPVCRPEVPAVERLLTLLALGARLRSGQLAAERQAVPVGLALR